MTDYGLMYYGMDGEPISQQEAYRLMGDSELRRVDSTTVGEHWVSTVLLVLDHSFGRGRPVIFETMIFGPSGSQWDAADWSCLRACTVEEARENHREAVTVLRTMLDVQQAELSRGEDE